MTTMAGKITALIPDHALFGKLTLGEVREFITATAHLRDDHPVAYPGKDTQGRWNRPLVGGVLEVMEYDPENDPTRIQIVPS